MELRTMWPCALYAFWTLLIGQQGRARGTSNDIGTEEWFVSQKGFDQRMCKSRQRPCRTLDFVISLAGDNDVIHLDGNGLNEEEGWHALSRTDSDHVITLLDKGLHLTGYNGLPHIELTPSVREVNETMYIKRHRAAGKCNVTLSHLVVQNGFLSFGNCSSRLYNVTFVNASVISPENCQSITMEIYYSKWFGKHICDEQGICENRYLNKLKCYFTTLKIYESQFYQQAFVVDSFRQTHIEVSSSLFSNSPDDINLLGGLQFTFSALSANILITNCTFKNQVHPTRVMSVINLYEAAIWLKASQLSASNDSTNASAVVENCLFYNNERGMTMVGPFRVLEINRCTFENNMAMHAGAAILVLISKYTHLDILNCNFTGNIAGSYRSDYITKEKEKSFEVVGSEVHLNADCCKGVITMVGKGGAVRVQRGQVMLVNSTFQNNTASLLGGSVFVDIDGYLTISNSHFRNTPIHEHSLQGDILYSDGKMKVDQVVLDVTTARNGLSIFRHSGDHWSLDITNAWIECPVGYDLRTTNSSAYGVTSVGLRRSYKLDQLSYYCESCPRNKYSLDRGYLNYTMKFVEFAYFTLLINGSTPKPQYTGQYIHHEIQCDECPYGGHCVQGITSVANFWGYKYDHEVFFQHCPKGYCCSTPQCPSLDACSEHREGRLCGRCSLGYSEALFSPVCVKNEICSLIWLWPFFFSIGLGYALFLMFQTDLKNFLFNRPFRLCSKCFKNKRPKSTFCRNTEQCMNGKLKHELVDRKITDDSEAKFLNHVSEVEDNGVDTVLNSVTTSNPKKDATASTAEFTASDSGLLIVIFYYFQDALLLHVQTVYVTSESKTQVLVKSILSGLLRFQLDIFELIEEICAVPDLTAVPKSMAKVLVVPYIILIFLTMFIIYRCSCFVKGKAYVPRELTTHNFIKYNSKSFSSRLSSGFILALLFMFQKLGTTTFTLLNCVPIKDEQALFIDGTITCYQYWQYGVMAYAISCVSPFFVVLLIGPSLLYRGHISLRQFFVASLFPMPFLLFWLIQSCRGRYCRSVSDRRRLADSSRAVLQILQGPYKENECGLCWAGVLIGRRLILILLFTFVNDALIRLLVMLLACFFILLHHVHVQPYKDKRGNIAGTCSAAALVTLGTINLVRAGFEAAEYTPSGPNAFLMKVFGHIENTLLLWVPLGIMCAVTLLFIVRVCTSLFSAICTHPEHPQMNNTRTSDLTK